MPVTNPYYVQTRSDTVNVASRMESNGEKDRIHMSSDTAKLLEESGKGHWISARKDKVVAKGKGEMETYWLLTREKSANPAGSNAGPANDGQQNGPDHGKDDLLLSSASVPELVIRTEKFQRMIDFSMTCRRRGSLLAS